MRVVVPAALLALAAGCGRLGFDGRDGGTSDAAPVLVRPSFDWVTTIHGAGAQVITSVVAVSDGVVIAGHVDAVTDFGGGPRMPVGDEDAFVAKYDLAGVHVWSRTFGSPLGDQAFSATGDAAGNVYVSGRVRGTTDFGAGPVAAFGNEDGFVASYDPTGGLRWARVFGNPANGDMVFGVEVAGDTVYGTGWFTNTVNFGDQVQTSASEQDVFVVAIDLADGATRRSWRFGATDLDQGQKIAVRGDRVAVCGFYLTAIDFGAGPIAGDTMRHDSYAVEFSTTGVLRWSKTAGMAGNDDVIALDVDDGERTYLIGESDGALDFGAEPIGVRGASEGFLVALDGDGSSPWTRVFTGDGSERVEDVVVVGGAILVAMRTDGATLIGATPVTAIGQYDSFVIAFDRDGAVAWTYAIGGPMQEAVRQIDVASDGAIYAVGTFAGTTDFGSGPRVSTSGGTDAFLVRLRQP